MGQNTVPRNEPPYTWRTDFQQGASGGSTAFSANGAGQTAHTQETDAGPSSYTAYEN